MSTLELSAKPASGARARAFVVERAQAVGFDRATIADIEVAVGEAVTNALLYGCAGVEDRLDAVHITVRTDDKSFVIEVTDHGPGFDERLVRHTAPGNGEETGGRGLLLMRALMDRVSVHCDPSKGTTVRMERFLPG